MTTRRLLLLLLIALPIFGFLIHQVVTSGPATEFDREISSQMEVQGRTAPALVLLFEVLTFLGGAPFLVVLTTTVVMLLAVRGERWLAGALAGTAAGGALLNHFIKIIVQRPRPEFAVPLVYESSWSFPSGHSMGSMVVYGMLGYVMAAALGLGRSRLALFAGLAVLVLGIGCSRIYLGAHWPSDVAGGFSAGAAWLGCCIWATERARRRFQLKTV